MRLSSAAAVLTLLGLADAAMSRKKWSLCWTSCSNCLDEVPFSDVPFNMTVSERLCRSNLSQASHYICIQIGCGEHDRKLAIEAHQKTCQQKYGVVVPSFEQVANYTLGEIDRFPLVKKDDVLTGKSFDTPVLPSRYFFKIWFDTLVSRYPTDKYRIRVANKLIGSGIVCALVEHRLRARHHPLLGRRSRPRYRQQSPSRPDAL